MLNKFFIKKKIHIIINLFVVFILLCSCGKQTNPEYDYPDLKNDTGFAVTSYKDMTDNQGMFYSIYNIEDGSLIIIDGGNTGNADYLSSVIEHFGNHVDAWIFTHYHPDHVDAFNALFESDNNISIDAIYLSPMDLDQYRQVAEEWDGVASYEKFLDITRDYDNIVKVERNDHYNICGLDFDFFNSYDITSQQGGDIPNNSGLVFKVSASNESMLFCSDVHSQYMSELLMNLYGDKLKADYLQAPHHGNNTYNTAFYDLVEPKEVIFDAPVWLMTGEGYNTINLITWCDENGVKYRSYVEAPNTIILK